MSRKTIDVPASERLLPGDLPQQKSKLRLTCGKCGHTGRYNVGSVLFDPRGSEGDGEAVVKNLSFSGYFRCTKCHSAWPWHVSTRTKLMLMGEIARLALGMGSEGVAVGTILLFDGTICRSGADGEDCLRERIADDPEDFYLHNRLGNLYRHHEMLEQARASYGRALELNPRDAESWYNVSCLHQDAGRNDEAVHGFQQTLRYASHCRHVDPQDRRSMVRDALEQLFGLHDPQDGVDFLPPIEPLPGTAPADANRPIVFAFEFDLGTEEGWEKLSDMYYYGTALHERAEQYARLHNHVQRRDAAHESRVGDKRIPRNRPCPCGSGRKYKNCCAGDA